MAAWTVLIGLVVVAMLTLAGAAVFERQIAGWLRRRWPAVDPEADLTLLVALVAVAAFSAGLLVMYAVR